MEVEAAPALVQLGDVPQVRSTPGRGLVHERLARSTLQEAEGEDGRLGVPCGGGVGIWIKMNESDSRRILAGKPDMLGV